MALFPKSLLPISLLTNLSRCPKHGRTGRYSCKSKLKEIMSASRSEFLTCIPLILMIWCLPRGFFGFEVHPMSSVQLNAQHVYGHLRPNTWWNYACPCVFLLFWEVCLRLSCALAFWWLTLASARARALSFHPVATRDVVKNELDAYFTHDHTISHTHIFDGCLKCLPFHESHRQEWRVDKTIIIESLRIV